MQTTVRVTSRRLCAVHGSKRKALHKASGKHILFQGWTIGLALGEKIHTVTLLNPF